MNPNQNTTKFPNPERYKLLFPIIPLKVKHLKKGNKSEERMKEKYIFCANTHCVFWASYERSRALHAKWWEELALRV